MITEIEAEILSHTSRTGRYVTDEDSVIKMAEQGLLKDYGPQPLAGGMHYFTLTGKGSKELELWREAQPKPIQKPKLTKKQIRSKIRYQYYIERADCWDSFRHFLQWERKFPVSTYADWHRVESREIDFS